MGLSAAEGACAALRQNHLVLQRQEARNNSSKTDARSSLSLLTTNPLILADSRDLKSL
jgi:hypothetical protein